MKKLILLAAAVALSTPAVNAQTRTGKSQSATPTTGDVSASTYGSGTTSPTDVGVTGGGAATAENGGTASTQSTAKFNNNMARQRSTALARDDDERARSRTATQVRKDGAIRSRSMSIYKEQGEKPVIDRQTTVVPKPK